MGQREKAVSIIKEARLNSQSPELFLLFEGDLLTEDRNYNGAEKSYEAAIALEPNDVGIQLKLANLLMAQSKLKRLKRFFGIQIKDYS